MLTPTLRDPSDLLNKLIREQRRSFHGSAHPTHVADHFYNFCVTILALRDYVAEARGLDKRAFANELRAHPVLAACGEIANTMKHAVLDYPPQTKGAALGTMEVMEVNMNAEGHFGFVPADRSTMIVRLSDDTTVNAWQLTQDAIGFWRKYFAEHGLSYTPQSEAEAFGTAEESVDIPDT